MATLSEQLECLEEAIKQAVEEKAWEVVVDMSAEYKALMEGVLD